MTRLRQISLEVYHKDQYIRTIRAWYIACIENDYEGRDTSIFRAELDPVWIDKNLATEIDIKVITKLESDYKVSSM